MFGSWQLLSRTTNSASSEQAESLRFSLGVGDIVRFSRTAERRSVHHRVAPDLILFQIRPGPDLGLQIRPGPGLELNVLELEA